MLRILKGAIVFSLCSAIAAIAAEDTIDVSNRLEFVSISGLHLTEQSLKTLAMTTMDCASFYSMRASVNLTYAEVHGLLSGPFFDWWDSGVPSYHVWKATVLFDGAYDEFVPEESSIQYHIYIHDRTESVRRLYLLASRAENDSRLYFFYLSTMRRVVPKIFDSGDDAAEDDNMPNP